MYIYHNMQKVCIKVWKLVEEKVSAKKAVIDIAVHGRDPKAEAPDVSYIICEERGLMWPLHSQCRTIIEQISCCLHTRLQSDSIKCVYFVEKHLFHSVVVWDE